MVSSSEYRQWFIDDVGAIMKVKMMVEEYDIQDERKSFIRLMQWYLENGIYIASEIETLYGDAYRFRAEDIHIV